MIRAFLVALALAVTVSPASAFTFILNDATGLPVKWPSGTVRLTIKLGTTQNLTDGSSYNTSAQAAAELWNVRMGAIQFQSTLAAAGAPAQRNSANELGFSSTIFGKDFEDNVLAVTSGFSDGHNQRTEADITFNTEYTWDSYRAGRTPSSPGAIDLQRVALHELGHLLGLDHPDQASPPQPVSAVMNSRVSTIDALTTDDIQGVQALYGPPGTPANNNFASATTVDLSAGSAVVQGYNTNANKESGEPVHDAASTSNPGGRSVWWRITPGVTSPISIDTRGSYFDTTLAVYTGTAVNNLKLVASSDDIDPGVVQASSLSFGGTAGTTYYIAVDGFNSNDGTGADCGGIKLNINLSNVAATAPVITSQPASVTVTAGDPVTFSVTATGTPPLTYQWRLNNLTISGATESSFSLNRAASGNAGNYSVVVTNIVGSTTSANAMLTVNAAPSTPTTPTPPSSGGGGGGGGGAPSLWFLTALAVLGFGRRWQRGRR